VSHSRFGRFGRFGEAGLWVLVALRHGPRGTLRLLDEVRDLGGRIGPATLLGAVARLERLDLIEGTAVDGTRAYRLIEQRADSSVRGGTT
jgi:DNA-binding PadR family transcriptional regulator